MRCDVLSQELQSSGTGNNFNQLSSDDGLSGPVVRQG